MKALNTMTKSFSLAVAGLIAVLAMTSGAQAQVSKDLSGLGSNGDSRKRAARLENRSRVSLVQNRTVSRDMRFELGASFAPVAAGDSYLYTQYTGVNLDFHLNPKFSVGVRYAGATNQLTNEGQNQFNNAQAMKNSGNLDYRVPDIDQPVNSLMGVMNWYMTYGKINLFDMSIVQFDIYSLAGLGQVKLQSGSAMTWTAGGGIGFWLNQHLTTRFELRYQTYQDQVYSGPRDLNLVVANFGIGALLW